MLFHCNEAGRLESSVCMSRPYCYLGVRPWSDLLHPIFIVVSDEVPYVPLLLHQLSSREDSQFQATHRHRDETLLFFGALQDAERDDLAL